MRIDRGPTAKLEATSVHLARHLLPGFCVAKDFRDSVPVLGCRSVAFPALPRALGRSCDTVPVKRTRGAVLLVEEARRRRTPRFRGRAFASRLTSRALPERAANFFPLQTGRMPPLTSAPLLTALAEHPLQGTPHAAELTRSIDAADECARGQLSDDPEAVYGVWKCLRTVGTCFARYFKNTRTSRERH